MVRSIMMSLTILFCSEALAQNYYSQHAMGWHWYDDPKELQKQSKPTKPLDAIQQLHSMKRTIKRALDEAILEPTPKNVKHYIELQNALSQRSENFSKIWQQVLLSNPELNFSMSHPTNGVALKVYHDKRQKQGEQAIKNFAQHSGLFFFYRSTCPYCKRFSPLLKAFAEHYGITIIPITLDGIALPEFPDSKQDHGQAKTFHVTVEPSLFAVNPYTHKAYPVSYGLATEDELKARILQVIAQQKKEAR